MCQLLITALDCAIVKIAIKSENICALLLAFLTRMLICGEKCAPKEERKRERERERERESACLDALVEEDVEHADGRGPRQRAEEEPVKVSREDGGVYLELLQSCARARRACSCVRDVCARCVCVLSGKCARELQRKWVRERVGLFPASRGARTPHRRVQVAYARLG